MGILKDIVQRVMAMDLTTKDIKLRVAKLFNLSEDEAARVIIRARSELKKQRVREAKRKIVFIPQCLRKRECKAPLTEEGFQCQSCSADCQARRIREAALAGGAQCFIVPGGTMVRNIIARHSPDAVVGVACHKEVEEGLNECDKVGVPAVGVTLLRDGCVNTLVDVEEVKAVLEEAGLAPPSAAPQNASSAPARAPRVSKPKAKAQVSLELLLVLAALAALFLAFLPFANQTRAATDYAAAFKQEQLVLAQTAADCREARLLGEGTRYSREWFLPAETTFYFESETLALKAVFAVGGERGVVSEPLGFGVSLEKATLPKGNAIVFVENSGGAVTVKARFQEAK